MTPEQFLSLEQIKRRCGISGTDLDAQLGIFREAAINTIQTRTRRNILDRTGVKVRSPDPGYGKEFITFYIYDSKPITETVNILYRTAQEDPGFNRDGTLAVPSKAWDVRGDRVCAYNATGESGAVVNWPERDKRVFYEAEFDVGIPEGQAPAEFTAAALMLIRELQEGSAMDELPHNIVDLVLRDHVVPGFTATDDILTDAGVK